MTATIHRYQSQVKLGGGAGLRLRAAIDALSGDRETVTIGLCGGRSVSSVLTELAGQLRWLDQLTLRKLHFFLVDERLVPLDHPESNYQALRRLFFDTALRDGWIHGQQIHPFEFDPDAVEESILAYGRTLEEFGGKLDLVLLSSGEDGHVASLFPNHPALFDSTAPFVLVENAPKPPAVRMSASLSLLSSARIAFLLFVGEAKRDAMRRLGDASIDFGTCPAKLVHDTEHFEVFTTLAELPK